MDTVLADRRKLDELSRIVENIELDSSLEEFIQSLSLPSEEESAVRDSLKQLPPADVQPSALPKAAPNLIRMAWWQ